MNNNMGIVRRIDPLGRIALPVEMRRSLEITDEDPLEVFTEDSEGRIILRKYRTQECIFCKSMENIKYFRDWFVCSDCIQELQKEKPVARTSS